MTGKTDRHVEKVERGLLINMDTERFIVDDVTAKQISEKDWKKHLSGDRPCDHPHADACFCKGSCSCHFVEVPTEAS